MTAEDGHPSIRSGVRGTVVVAASAALLLLPASRVSAGPAMASVKGTLTNSDTCGECHKDIYALWKKSAHSSSMENPVFVAAWREAESRAGAVTARLCLRCHAPMAEINNDWQLEKKITWEGVTCDVCHSIVSVEESGGNPRMRLQVGSVKRGPIRDAVSGVHEVAWSELHTTSLVCAGCHEYVNPEGTAIISTWSEWSASSASKNGTTCQSCHMAATRADVVDPRITRVGRVPVNLHDTPGGHSLDQLHKALRLTIVPSRAGDTLKVAIGLVNKGAGHAVPTGMPGRRVILGVQVVTSTGQSFEEMRIYTRNYQDAKGEVITRDLGYFAKGVALVSDTRIKPDERREERFAFAVPAPATALLTVTLNYEHTPTGGKENRTFLTFQSEKRTIMPVMPARGPG